MCIILFCCLCFVFLTLGCVYAFAFLGAWCCKRWWALSYILTSNSVNYRILHCGALPMDGTRLNEKKSGNRWLLGFHVTCQYTFGISGICFQQLRTWRVLKQRVRCGSWAMGSGYIHWRPRSVTLENGGVFLRQTRLARRGTTTSGSTSASRCDWITYDAAAKIF